MATKSYSPSRENRKGLEKRRDFRNVADDFSRISEDFPAAVPEFQPDKTRAWPGKDPTRFVDGDEEAAIRLQPDDRFKPVQRLVEIGFA